MVGGDNLITRNIKSLKFFVFLLIFIINFEGLRAGNQQETGNENRTPKSATKAFFLSLIIPGLGEYYAEKHSAIKYMAGMELVLWIGYLGMGRYADLLCEDYHNVARVNAGAPVEGKPKQYFIDVGNFSDTYRYNNKKQVDRLPGLVYPITEEYFWQWDSDVNRKRFKDIRLKSDTIRSQARYVAAAIFVNHVVSAVNAAITVNRWNKRVVLSSSNYYIGNNPTTFVNLSYKW